MTRRPDHVMTRRPDHVMTRRPDGVMAERNGVAGKVSPAQSIKGAARACELAPYA